MRLNGVGGYEARLWLASNFSDRLAPRVIRPTDASIKLTENCQAQCVTCDYWKARSTDRISAEAAIALIGRLGDLGVKTLRFTGGEPLLRRDFFAILDEIDPSPFGTIGLQTNGLLLKRLAGRVNDSPLTHVSVSLDAAGERNDEIRGVRGYFDRAIEGLDLLEGKTRIIAMTLNQFGAGDLDVLIDHVERLGGYLACNLPDNRLYFLQGANLEDLWPDDRAAATMSTPSRLGWDHSSRATSWTTSDATFGRRHRAWRPGTRRASLGTPRSTSGRTGTCDPDATSCPRWETCWSGTSARSSPTLPTRTGPGPCSAWSALAAPAMSSRACGHGTRSRIASGAYAITAISRRLPQDAQREVIIVVPCHLVELGTGGQGRVDVVPVIAVAAVPCPVMHRDQVAADVEARGHPVHGTSQVRG